MRSPSYEGLPGSAEQEHEPLPAAVGAVPGIAVEGEVADDRVSVVLGAMARARDQMCPPPGAEVRVLDGQLADR
jgi:hypothetical protein